MVVLVGGQPLPNLLPVKHYRPDAVILLYTSTTREVHDRLRQTIQRTTHQRTTQLSSFKVDPYDIVATEKALEDQIQSFSSSNRFLNLTGGTKAMALAAYRVAERHRAEILYLESERKKSIAYRYVWRNGDLLKEAPEELPACLTLTDMLNVHFGPDMWHEYGTKRQEGSPFEEAIATALRQRVDEVMVGVKALNGQVDIDLVVRLGNQWGIIEAKSGKNGRNLDGIKQLSNAGRHLGTYTQQFYVITVEPTNEQKGLIAASRIQVVTLREYGSADQQLTDNDSEEIVEKVCQALQG